jgi:hypothetical protein
MFRLAPVQVARVIDGACAARAIIVAGLSGLRDGDMPPGSNRAKR